MKEKMLKWVLLSFFCLSQNPLWAEEIKYRPQSTVGNRGIVYVNIGKTPQHPIIEAPLAIPVVPDYVIDPPDSVLITVRGEPTLAKQVTVRPDGKITYPLVGEFFIQGLTPLQAQEQLKKELYKFVKEPEVTVEVIGFASKFIYVVGESGPARIPFTGNQRVLDALLQAGYVGYIGAKIDDIKIVRSDPYHPKIHSINLNKLVIKGDSRQNIYLQSGDIVRVPATLLRRLTYGVTTLTQPLTPILTGTTSVRSIYDLKNTIEGEETTGTTVVAPVVTGPTLTTGGGTSSTVSQVTTSSQ